VLTGVSLDKVAKWERWGSEEASEGASSKLLDRLEAVLTSGAELKLTIGLPGSID